jgi:DedD protein
MPHAAVRHLEQLEEDDPHGKTPRPVTALFLACGGACLIFAAIALAGRKSTPKISVNDPLTELVAQRTKSTPAGPKASDLSAKDVTFPSILSDSDRPTTAMAAVRSRTAPAPSIAIESDSLPPPATDRLPVVPLPAQQVLGASPVVTRPRDSLTRVASESAQVTQAPTPTAAAGHEGGYSLQVSSFRTDTEATAFAEQLRGRGHKSYIVEAHVPGRGTWYRVRVGPFPNQQAAAAYRQAFEAKEHVVPFVIAPTSQK